MSTPLMVLSRQTQFGALVRKGLQERQFDVHITADFADAIRHLKRNACPVVLLDAEIEDADLSLVDIGLALRQIKTDVQFIVVTRAGLTPDTSPLTPRATLFKPITISALQHSVSQAMSSPALIQKSPPLVKSLAETSQLIWLQDVSRAAQQLTRLTLESSAQAALITRDADLWAYAGQLSRDAAQELAHSIQNSWDDELQTDLLRFVRLQSTDAQHMLYATRLSKNMALALVFDAETPLSTIRGQASSLARSLTETPPPVAESAPEDAFSSPEDDFPPLSQLLGDVPPPNPVPGRPEAPAPVPAPAYPARPYSRESSPPIPLAAIKRSSSVLDETMLSQGARLSEVAQDVPPDLAVTRRHNPAEDPQTLMETRPGLAPAESVTEVAHRIVLEPASPTMYNLNYACLLVPRFEQHHLIGDLADRLSEWIGQVCIAFGCRLEHISIRPEYVQWVIGMPPNTAPGYIMRQTRQQTSERIFDEFPRFRKENPSGDFWAPGYLIMGGSQPPPQTLVRGFIRQTRERQGLRPKEG